MTDLLTLNDFWKLAWDRDALEDGLRKDISSIPDSPIVGGNMLLALKREQQMKKDTQSSLNQFMHWATEEKIAGLQALLDAPYYRFSEEHDWNYEYYKKEIAVALSASARIRKDELTEVWSRSIGRRVYPSLIIDRI